MSNVAIKFVSALEKVFLWNTPESFEDLRRISGLKGEIISFQAIFTGDENGVATVQVTSTLERWVRVRRVGQVPVTTPATAYYDDNYLSLKPGLYPDILQDMKNNTVKIWQGRTHAVWIDIDVASEISAGDYNVDISICNPKTREAYAGASLEVRVVNATLPEQKLIHTEWFYGDCIADYYELEVFSEKHWEYIGYQLQSAVRMGVNMILTPLFTPPLDTSEGGERTTIQLIGVKKTGTSYQFDFSKFDRWIILCQSVGIKYFEMSHLFSQWGAKYAPKIMAEVDGESKKLFGWHTSGDSPEYAEFLGIFLPQLTRKLEDMGIAEVTYFHVSDEPSLAQLDAYLKAKTLIEKYLQGYLMIDALSDYDFYSTGAVAKPIPSNDHIAPFIKNQVPGLWTYYCVGQGVGVSNRFVSMPSARNRILAVQLYKYAIEGFLHWGFNYYSSGLSLEHINPFLTTDADYSFPAGDAYMIYPGKGGKPVESIRYMVFMHTMQDLRALQLLETLTDYEYVLRIIEGGLQNPISFDEYPKNARYLLELRESVNSEIEKRISDC